MADNSNPYQAPSSQLAEPAATELGEIAGKGRRFGTFVVDYFGCTFSGAFLGALIGLTLGEQGVTLLDGSGGFVLGLLVFVAYYIFFEGLWARTPGKLLFGTKVVTVNGERPDFRQIVKRSFCRLIPFEAFSFFGELGWHDRISETRVVLAR